MDTGYKELRVKTVEGIKISSELLMLLLLHVFAMSMLDLFQPAFFYV